MSQCDAELFGGASEPGETAEKSRIRRVLVVDDHPIVRHGLRSVMEGEDDLAICGETESAGGARLAISQLNPDALICDIGINHFEGIELIRSVRAHHPRLPVLVLSSHDEIIYAERMLSIGATGYIMKEASSEEFLVALRRVLDGHVYVSQAVGNGIILKHASRKKHQTTDPIDRLSIRELQILLMIGKGLSTRETAESLHLSVKTVESHRQRIKRKLNLTTGVQLLRYAVMDIYKRELSSSP